jgi:putative transposase
MTFGLRRIYGQGHLHFITCSCFDRQPNLEDPERRNLFLQILSEVRERYRFALVGYVVMPEHFHLLLNEPEIGNPSVVMQVLKQRVARKLLRDGCPTLSAPAAERVGHARHFWMKRFYDFNVWSERKRVEKLHYMHLNPVTRGLVEHPKDWAWSSYRYWQFRDETLLRCDYVE